MLTSYVQFDPIYLDPKDLEHLVCRTALVSTQVYKTKLLNFGVNIITSTAILLGKFEHVLVVGNQYHQWTWLI